MSEPRDFWWDLVGDLRAGRNERPGLFFDVVTKRRDPRTARSRFQGFPNLDTQAAALFDAYTSADWPCRREGREWWVLAFRQVGYLVDGDRDEAARPAEPVHAWRAAGVSDLTKPGLSWSASRAVAAFFIEYNLARGIPSHVYEAVIAPEQQLAIRSHADRDPTLDALAPSRESGAVEYVADVPAEQWTRC